MIAHHGNDTFNRVFQALEQQQLADSLSRWTQNVRTVLGRELRMDTTTTLECQTLNIRSSAIELGVCEKTGSTVGVPESASQTSRVTPHPHSKNRDQAVIKPALTAATFISAGRGLPHYGFQGF